MKKTAKTDYSISYRYRKKNGFDYSEWFTGEGQFQNIELIQRQVRSIVQAHKSDIEIKIIYNGQMIDFEGKPTDKTLKYDVKR